ncbi:MAG: hypothetical protein ACOYMN_21510 [Roseimicrobium sp.]
MNTPTAKLCTRANSCVTLAATALALASCVDVNVPRYGRRGHVEVIAPGTRVSVGAPSGYIEVLPYNARTVVVRGESCWYHQGRHYRRHGRGYVVFYP